MTLQELLAKLREIAPQPEAFASALKEAAQGLYQHIFDAGHAVATARFNADKTALEGQLENANKAKEKAERRVAQLEAEKPDVQKIRDEYKEEIERLTREKQEALDAGEARVRAVLDSRAVSDLKAVLIGEHGVDSVYAEVLADRAKARIHHVPVKDKPGEHNLEVLVEGKTIPIQTDKPLAALASEIAEKVDAKFKTGKVDTGAGTRTGGAGGGGNIFSKVREDVKKRAEAKGTTTSAADRLSGGGRVAANA